MMYQAIQTFSFPPTNYLGARVKARCDAGSLTRSWDHALNIQENHTLAAAKLADKLGWNGVRMIGGALPSPASGYAFVFLPIATP